MLGCGSLHLLPSITGCRFSYMLDFVVSPREALPLLGIDGFVVGREEVVGLGEVDRGREGELGLVYKIIEIRIVEFNNKRVLVFQFVSVFIRVYLLVFPSATR